jgi:hypothetical protein
MSEIAAWDTGQGHNSVIIPQVHKGLLAAGEKAPLRKPTDYYGQPKASLFYGVLRGNTPIIEGCVAANVDWWFLDNGFFRPGHYHGHYRVGRRALQPKFSPTAPVDVSRWKALGIKVQPWRTSTSKSHVLVCPQTPAMAEFYKIPKEKWLQGVLQRLATVAPGRPVRIREKGTPVPLAEDLSGCHCVITFNSKVAFEGLIKGIPAIMDRGTVRDWNDLTVHDVEKDLTAHDRLALFHFAASCQFRLEEFKDGSAWKAVRKILG